MARTTGQTLYRHWWSTSSFAASTVFSHGISERWQVVSGHTVCYNSKRSPRKAPAASGSSLSVSRRRHLDLAEK
jgi:hypothetical protein